SGQVHRLPDAPEAYGAMITRAKAAPAQSRSTDLWGGQSRPWVGQLLFRHQIPDTADKPLIEMLPQKNQTLVHQDLNGSIRFRGGFTIGIENCDDFRHLPIHIDRRSVVVAGSRTSEMVILYRRHPLANCIRETKACEVSLVLCTKAEGKLLGPTYGLYRQVNVLEV